MLAAKDKGGWQDAAVQGSFKNACEAVRKVQHRRVDKADGKVGGRKELGEGQAPHNVRHAEGGLCRSIHFCAVSIAESLPKRPLLARVRELRPIKRAVRILHHRGDNVDALSRAFSRARCSRAAAPVCELEFLFQCIVSLFSR